ncbi:hypothetical protein AKJ39_04665 [candidate division MSBL1 archaeon SCGC-AAA259J03]|uniref:Polymerase/histidinol phosphatase N-terminal domain-containing protein n=2 Tax=candidate division MSBL1 TaxID=215777 RepID=A0A656YVK9_9EURY|nr:hypothetical protein AKJ36_02580 [candidate division MSBL1 archaeon SCGC-AAA259I07]KXA96397.1 hypothetical protein AKJ39_04665 [candidate division MSBL1 archaeon SCGC-AAA259J03]
MLTIDLHVHTLYSGDSDCEISDAIESAKRKGLDGIAITDHDSVAGLEEAMVIASEEDFLVIPGIEISSGDGHILGLGVSEQIPAGLSAAKTVEKIREKGGIAISAHPFSLDLKPFSALRAEFDAVEVFNPKRYIGNRLAENYAQEYNLSKVGGSDAHFCDEVGLAGIRLDAKPEVDEILKRIKEGRTTVFGRYLPLSNYLQRIFHRVPQL